MNQLKHLNLVIRSFWIWIFGTFFLTLSNLTYISTIYNSLNPFVPKSNNAQIENNTHCVYAIGFSNLGVVLC